MIVFNYTGKDKNGDIVRGQIEAESDKVAARILAEKHIITISLTEDQEKGLTLFDRVSLKDKVVLMRQLSTMINAGLPIAQSLKTLQIQTGKAFLKKILASAISDVEGGDTLSSAFSKFPKVFSPLDITLISSGETSGNLDKSLARMADQLEKQQSLVRKIRGAFIYPIFVLVVIIVVIAVMIVYVMPQMEGLYTSFGAKLPLMTRILISTSHIVSSYTVFVLIFITGVIGFIIYFIRLPIGRRTLDILKINIPVINLLIIKMYMARFSRTLAGLVASGVPLLDCLAIVSKSVGNIVYEELIKDAREKVKSGAALSQTLLGNKLIPPVVPQMISVGEKTGELDNMLTNLANYYEDEVDTTVKSISTLIEPLLILVMAGLALVVVLAIMLPIYQFSSVVNKIR